MLDDLFNKHIQGMDFSNIEPTCENVHPMITKLIGELYTMDETENAWQDMLTGLEQQMRVCLSNELHDHIFNILPPAVSKHFEPYWKSISFYILTMAWLSKRAIGPEFGE